MSAARRPSDWLKRGGVYFAQVFAAGFVLGASRVPSIVPRTGERVAQLIETPFVLVAVALSARYVVDHRPAATSTPLLASGAVALSLMLADEVLVVLGLQGRALADHVAQLDPVGGSVYLVMLLVFALMPWLWGRGRRVAAG